MVTRKWAGSGKLATYPTEGILNLPSCTFNKPKKLFLLNVTQNSVAKGALHMFKQNRQKVNTRVKRALLKSKSKVIPVLNYVTKHYAMKTHGEV
jgi:hypothetical protein